jgi:transposase
MLALALVLEGVDRKTAAETCGMGRQTLRDWVHRYNAEGLAGLSNWRGAPRPRRLDAGQLAELVSWLEAGPDPAVDGVVRWRRQDLRARVTSAFGVEMHERTVGKYLAALGYRRLSVRPRHPKTDPEAQEAFKRMARPVCKLISSILPFQSAPTYPASEPCSPPRWSCARPGPHKTPSVRAPFFEPGLQVAVQLSGHLDPPPADIVGRAAAPRDRSSPATRPRLPRGGHSRHRCAAPPRQSAPASPQVLPRRR